MRIPSRPALAVLLGIILAPLSTAFAQASGVLIGVHRPGMDEQPDSARYETLWIARTPGGVRRATVSELLVPRADGFWRVGVAATCVRDPQWRIDRLWMEKASTPPVVQEGCPAVPASAVLFAGDSADRAALDTMTVVCAIENIEITFITGNFIGAEHYVAQTEDCEPRGGRYDVTPVVTRWASDSSLALPAVAGPRAESPLVRATHLALRKAPEECSDFAVDTTNFEWAQSDVGSWYVARDRGRWRAHVFGHVYGSDCSFDAPVDLSLPRSFTGHDVLRPSWATIRRAVPKAVDAVASPNGDMVVVITGDSLSAFAGSGTKLGARLLARPFAHQRVVMVQWATGANVARWDAEVARLAPTAGPATVKPEVPPRRQ
jgi:hypothetical protein